MSRRPRFTEDQLREAIGESRSWSETLRRLNYRSAGGNSRTLQKYAAIWKISTDQFDPDAARIEGLNKGRRKRPLSEILVENSSFSRGHLKVRLFAEGIKERRCELCGQGELWRGRRLALILDHINGEPDDHRLSNLRVVCPNCAATFETHCARKNRLAPMPRSCLHCGDVFVPNRREQRYCSSACGARWDRTERHGQSTLKGMPRPESRLVERPSYLRLLRDIEENGFLATGRKYGVSDNAIRKWVRFYENEIERRRLEEAGELDDPDARDEAA